MRRLIRFEDETGEPQSLLLCALLLLFAIPRTLRRSWRGELRAVMNTRRPLSVLDVQRASRWPRVTVRPAQGSSLRAALAAASVEVWLSRGGFTWTCLLGRGPTDAARRV